MLGTLPTPGVLNFGTAPPSPGLSMTFDVRGDTITASGTFLFPCSVGASSIGGGIGPLLTGTVAQDGSFEVASPNVTSSLAHVSLAVSGMVPKAAGASWSGTYTASEMGPPLCALSQTGSFEATPIIPVQGSYTGTGTAEALDEATGKLVPKTITLALTLRQGGTLYLLRAAPVTNSPLALTGSISVQGISCFSKGTTSTTVTSQVAGNRISPIFDMDDGSQAALLGYLSDVNADDLAIESLSVHGGACEGVYFFSPNHLDLERAAG